MQSADQQMWCCRHKSTITNKDDSGLFYHSVFGRASSGYNVNLWLKATKLLTGYTIDDGSDGRFRLAAAKFGHLLRAVDETLAMPFKTCIHLDTSLLALVYMSYNVYYI